MTDYEARRQANLRRNEALLRKLNLPTPASVAQKEKGPPKKRQKTSNAPVKAPTRSSARIAASTVTKPSYNDSESPPPSSTSTSRSKRPTRPNKASKELVLATTDNTDIDNTSSALTSDLATLRESWSAWTPAAPQPTRDPITNTFHFASHPSFTPNKSPAEILREGCFGGTYFRPLYSATLGITIEDDWEELPTEWTEGLDIARFLTSAEYDPSVNKYGVACGQSIEEWERAGWIEHRFDVRGWFQWYCRFFLGRRCEDDERQVGRWKRCVGETGRWRRTLLKKYVALGIRSVFAEDLEGEDEGSVAEVSPVVHQTCHHWAWEVRQETLDQFWETGA